MDFSGFSLSLTILILGLWGDAMVGLVESGGFTRNYTTWDDMKVDPLQVSKGTVNARDDPSGSRIIVVDKSGKGDSVTVQGAVDMVPAFNKQRVKIYILPGNYSEKVHVPKTKPYVSFIGDEKHSSKTVITWRDGAATRDPKTGSQLGTFNSASVFIESDYFCATGITFENTYVPIKRQNGTQAVALRVRGENALFYKVRILGAQDSLLDDQGKHYFLDSYIQGSVDFICGAATSLFENCVIHSTARPFGAIAAHKRNSPQDNSGFSFVNCTINGTGKILLGRAWGNYSRTSYSYCRIEDIIAPAGWSDWGEAHKQRTAAFGEYHNTGRGADRRGRVPWSKSLSDAEARPFLDMKYINGEQWLKLS